MYVLPILLGACVLALNVLLALRFRLYFWQDTASLALLTTSFLIGLILIGYGIVLRGIEPSRRTSAISESIAGDEPGPSPWHLRWAVLVPLLVALSAAVATVWGSVAADPASGHAEQRNCMDLYQQAVEIHTANPNFRMPSRDRDQVRCKINATLEGLSSPPG